MNWTPFFLFGGVVHAPCFWLKSPRCHLELVRVSGCLVEVGRNLIMLEGFAQCVFQPLFDFKNEAKQWNVIVEATHSEIYDKFLSKVDAWKNPYNTSWYVKKTPTCFLLTVWFLYPPSFFHQAVSTRWFSSHLPRGSFLHRELGSQGVHGAVHEGERSPHFGWRRWNIVRCLSGNARNCWMSLEMKTCFNGV